MGNDGEGIEMLYAHTDGESSDKSTWQPLSVHLNAVADLSSSFASKFDMAQWGHTLGVLHDAGKASAAFQRRLAGDHQRVDHSTAGAIEAVKRYGASGMLMAYALAGHHGGQPNGVGSSDMADSSVRTPLAQRLNSEIEAYDGFLDLVTTGQLTLPSAEDLPLPTVPGRSHRFNDPINPNFFSFYVLARMLFSCLVDADGLDTECVMNAEASEARQRREHDSLKCMLQKLLRHIERMDAKDTPVNRARFAVLDDCLEAGTSPQGLFTLTVPTGGGKTLSGMAFALQHAIANGMERIIVVAPFTAIISQTATRLKKIFGSENVLEHHSNYDFEDMDDEESYAARLATQNWDAPIVVTTNVQFFESLFASKPAKSRKVHNIVRSVVILDEAQTLPDSLLEPSLAMLEELAFAYGTSIVLCSATQPALDMVWPYGSQPQEIVTHRNGFDEAFGSRINYDMIGEVEVEELARMLASSHQSLCVVGTKRNALATYLALLEQATQQGVIEDRAHAEAGGIFHLSAFMTPDHRARIIESICDRLERQERCVVVSTQLIEAGVDIDFPEVYREIAGMDSIVQAAGRCNREGSRQMGCVHVFDLLVDGEQSGTSPWLDKMRSISRDLIGENGGRVDESLVLPFFQRRYQTESTDAKGIFKSLSKASILSNGFQTIPFEKTSLDYRIIEEDTVPLIVPFGDGGRALARELRVSSQVALLAKKAQRYSVSVPSWLRRQYQEAEVLEYREPFYVLKEYAVPIYYKSDVGLVRPGEEEPEFLCF